MPRWLARAEPKGCRDITAEDFRASAKFAHTPLKYYQRPVGHHCNKYALIAALIAVAAISAFSLVGTNLSSTFSYVASQL